MATEKPESLRIQQADKTGFCFGVRRAIDILEKVARERGGVETLGAVVHNEQVLERLAGLGVKVVRDVDSVRGDTVVTSSHGISPEIEGKIKDRHLEVVSTTCPFVHRAQVAARRLAEAGFLVVIYGDAEHPEVKGILGWTRGRGIAAIDEGFLSCLEKIPRRIGILSQTTQVPDRFTEFAKKVLGAGFARDSEFRIIDTICHDIRERQAAALRLARQVDLMLVVGGHHSANTNRLAELCGAITETHLVQTAADIRPSWLVGKERIGVTAGASTDERTVDEVLRALADRAISPGR